MAVACAAHVRRFGLEPKIALISHSDFGSADTPSALKMRQALRLLRERAPDLEVDGEMQADTALSLVVRKRVITNSRLEGEANVLIFPNLDAAKHGAAADSASSPTRCRSGRSSSARPSPRTC